MGWFVTVTPLFIPTGESLSKSDVEPVGGVVRGSSVSSVANAGWLVAVSPNPAASSSTVSAAAASISSCSTLDTAIDAGTEVSVAEERGTLTGSVESDRSTASLGSDSPTGR